MTHPSFDSTDQLPRASRDGERTTGQVLSPARADYWDGRQSPAAEVLALIRFGLPTAIPALPTAGCIVDVQLATLGDSAVAAECWWAHGPVQTGTDGRIRHASDGSWLFGSIEVDEHDHADVCAAAASAYREIVEFHARCDYPHITRMWNYLDAVSAGDGDGERYRQFCLGRARGLSGLTQARYPAATGIGRQIATGKLQIFWLSTRSESRLIENPRQVSAYHYPREHGPASPSFSRASLTPEGTLLVSGTASIVGHESVHVGDPLAQLDETVRNLQTLHALEDEHCLLKVYIRHAEHFGIIKDRLRFLAPRARCLFLAADVCRRELLLEIECVSHLPVAQSTLSQGGN